ncbi:MAG: hypothetical protein ISN64_00705 [Rickettsia sp.]|nr:hypothetical protein [Rickettsia sp.]
MAHDRDHVKLQKRKVQASFRSQICARSRSVDKENRKSKSIFKCITCSDTDNGG